MDKLRPLITFLQRQYFWLLTALLLLVGVGGMWTATGAVAEQFQGFKQKIAGKKGSLDQILGKRPHANDKVIEAQQAENVKLAENRREVWESLYNRQREEVLKWPPVRKDFDVMIRGKDFGDAILPRFCRHYQNFVKERFEELHKIVRAQDPNSRGARRRGQSIDEEEPNRLFGAAQTGSVVDWQDQLALRQKFVWDQEPTFIRVWVTQEDLWIFETLLNIVAKVNEDATIRENAAIQEIAQLQVGKEAAAGFSTAGRLYKPESQDGEGEFVEEYDADVESVPSASGEGGVDEELLAYRYLDREGKPIGNWKEGIPEYKRVPVRMTVKIDQRRIIDFLVACANQPLTVEVDQVRINVEANQQSTGRSAPSHPEEMFEEEEGGPATLSRGRAAKATGPDNQKSPEERRYVELSVQGVVYIFNPVDLGRLHLAESETAAGDELVGDL